METQPHPTLTDDRSYPLGFVVVPTFVGTLLWLIAMLSRVIQ